MMLKMIEKETRLHRNKADYGTADYYKNYKNENKGTEITRLVFGKVLSEFNSFLRDNLSKKGVGITLPQRMGRIELRKNKREVEINEDGTITNKLPINWGETRKLWASNKSAKEKKIKIRFTNEHTDGYAFRVTFVKSVANFKNKSLYSIKFNRQLKRDLSKSIFEGKIDAFTHEH